MATDKDFTAEEWQQIEAAPFMAGLAVTYGDLSAKRGIAEEAEATGKAVKAAVSAPGEVDAFSRFLLDTAKASANAYREGGFIGIGIAKVSEKEQMALAALALALGFPE